MHYVLTRSPYGYVTLCSSSINTYTLINSHITTLYRSLVHDTLPLLINTTYIYTRLFYLFIILNNCCSDFSITIVRVVAVYNLLTLDNYGKVLLVTLTCTMNLRHCLSLGLYCNIYQTYIALNCSLRLINIIIVKLINTDESIDSRRTRHCRYYLVTSHGLHRSAGIPIYSIVTKQVRYEQLTGETPLVIVSCLLFTTSDNKSLTVQIYTPTYFHLFHFVVVQMRKLVKLCIYQIELNIFIINVCILYYSARFYTKNTISQLFKLNRTAVEITVVIVFLQINFSSCNLKVLQIATPVIVFNYG